MKSPNKNAFWLVLPACLFMVVVTGIPIIYSVWQSLNRVTLTSKDTKFVGLDNYISVLSSNYWWTALLVTLTIVVVSVFFEFILGFLIAFVMYKTIYARSLLRTIVLIPYGLVTVVSAYSWLYAWTPETGYLANLLPTGTAPLTDKFSSLLIIIFAEIWKTTPFMSLLLLAGLTLVSEDMLKAASVDGASNWQKLWKIIIPSMKPAILVALLFRTIDAFRIFDTIYVLTKGSNNTYSVSILGYDNLFKAFNVGIGSAISILIFCCVALISLVFFKVLGAKTPSEEGEISG